jgi:hypothetical protein
MQEERKLLLAIQILTRDLNTFDTATNRLSINTGYQYINELGKHRVKKGPY